MEKKELQVLNFTKNKKPEENMEHYLINKEKRVTGQKISHKKAKKKKVSKAAIVATISLLCSISISGVIHYVGNNAVAQDVIESNIDYHEAYSNRTSNGFGFYKSETHEEIDGDKYLEQIKQRGIEQGFTVDEMAIYLSYSYGLSPDVIEGSSSLGRTGARLEACGQLIQKEAHKSERGK